MIPLFFTIQWGSERSTEHPKYGLFWMGFVKCRVHLNIGQVFKWFLITRFLMFQVEGLKFSLKSAGIQYLDVSFVFTPAFVCLRTQKLLKYFFSWSLLLPLILCDFAIFLQILYKNTTGWIVWYSNAILIRYSLTIPYLTKITTIKFDHHLWISIYWFCFGMAKTILILK